MKSETHMKTNCNKVIKSNPDVRLSNIYMAHRYATRYRPETIGPFDNADAALACAKDCLYPELAEVQTIDLTAIMHSYAPEVNDKSSVISTETYFLFSDDIDEIPSNLQGDLNIATIELDDGCEDCWHTREDELPDGLIIGALVSRMERRYECMYVVAVQNSSAISALLLTVKFDRVVRTTNSDRRKLLDMREEAKYIKTWAHDPNKNLDERAQNLANDFWACFVKDNSPVPVSSLEQWDCMGLF